MRNFQYYCESSQFCIPYLIFRYTALDRANAGSGEGAVARPTGVGGRESRRRAYRDVFTASCRASDRTLPTRELSFAGVMQCFHDRYCESSQIQTLYLIFRYTALDRANAGSGEGAVARPTGVGGRDSRRRAYRDVFTASCRASDRTLHHLARTFICQGDGQAFMNVTKMLAFLPKTFGI